MQLMSPARQQVYVIRCVSTSVLYVNRIVLYAATLVGTILPASAQGCSVAGERPRAETSRVHQLCSGPAPSKTLRTCVNNTSPCVLPALPCTGRPLQGNSDWTLTKVDPATGAVLWTRQFNAAGGNTGYHERPAGLLVTGTAAAETAVVSVTYNGDLIYNWQGSQDATYLLLW